MRFDSIAGSIGEARVKTARQRWQSLTLELGVREDNEHVGSGLGGNNAQLLTLLTYRHRLTNTNKMTIDPVDGWVRWGEGWLMGNGKKVLRQELDTILPVPKTATVDEVQCGKWFSLGPQLNNLHTLLFACKMCSDLASELDKGIESNVKPVGLALRSFPPEMILFSVRRYIQIERLVRHNLDEHPAWSKTLSNINKAVDN